ncbi:AT-hook motif nuclear-localized protein 17-like [Aristolochia californica]|uniref:AT-hook motif nuclear-localized protein 17-like n=1 Tax=Aristolochia californica TaxID=171875 RepID=UPI0035D6E2A0
MKAEYEDERRRECQTSEEDDTRSSGGSKKSKQITTATATSADGATIEVVRRPRGRPPGSKNKPKPPIIITREAESAMRPHVLEVPGGQDVVQAITQYARRKSIGLCLLAGSGTVANVTLRQPGPTPGPTVTFHGRFEILSISATFLPPSCSLSSVSNGFAISLAGAQGQIVGGSVVGSLLAVGTVVVVAAVFGSPTYHRLSVEDEISGPPAALSPPETTHHQQQHQHQHQQSHQHQPPAESCGMSLYSCHLPSDVIWAPTPRPQQPPPPY